MTTPNAKNTNENETAITNANENETATEIEIENNIDTETATATATENAQNNEILTMSLNGDGETSISNQETEIAAMVDDKKPPITTITTKEITTLNTQQQQPQQQQQQQQQTNAFTTDAVEKAAEAQIGMENDNETLQTTSSQTLTAATATVTETVTATAAAAATATDNFKVPAKPLQLPLAATSTPSLQCDPSIGGAASSNNINNAGGGSLYNTNSLKKRRSKNSTTSKRNGNETRNISAGAAGRTADNSNNGNSSGGSGCSGIIGAITSNIKTSLSMTSLPPDEKEESRDVIKAKLKVERPYNSLKKNADRHLGSSSTYASSGNNSKKLHRYSWGSSAHSHSSSSLHSSATLGLGSGKDDLWAAIQTNYNYIMDTNLLDTCKEARCEIEGVASAMENPTELCFKMLDDTQRSEGSCEDPKQLRKWLRQMEHKLDSAPTLSQATHFSIAELQRHLSEYSVLYHEIVSHARVVSACIRAASEREQQQQQQLQLQQQQSTLDNSNTSSPTAEQNHTSLSSTDEPTTATTSTSAVVTNSSGIGTNSSLCSSIGDSADAVIITTTIPPTSPTTSHNSSSGSNFSSPLLATTSVVNSTNSAKKVEGNLDRLQNRYHLLYLKALEVQLWLDSLLRKKSSSLSGLYDDLDDDEVDDDEEEEDYSEHDCIDGGATDVTSDLESDVTNNSSSCDLQDCNNSTDNSSSAGGSGNNKHSSAIAQKSRDCLEARLLKSADASSDDDDEGWLYSSAPPATVTTAATANHNNSNISNSSSSSSNCLNSNIATIVVDGLQSSAVSSTTTATTKTTAGNDDSDKENKEALAQASSAVVAVSTTNHRYSINSSTSSASSLLNSTQIATAEIQLSSSSNTAATATAFAAHTNVISCDSTCSSSNCDSSCSSNDLLTETTTSATTTTQITQMRCQQPMLPPSALPQVLHRTEMELQINGGNSAAAAAGVTAAGSVDDSDNSSNNNSNNQRIELQNAMPQEEINANSQKDNVCFYTRADICNITVNANDIYMQQQQQQALLCPSKRLPPRSPAKSSKSQKSNGSLTRTRAKNKVSHESIKQLVLGAEHLVRDEALKTPTKQKHTLVKISSTVKKREVIMPGPIKQRVQEWLEHQPSTPQPLHHKSHDNANLSASGAALARADDCEASGEASETDSIPQPGSDTSEGFTDSIATCMQTSTNSNSYGHSTERIGGSAEPIIGATTVHGGYGSSNQSLNMKIVKRPQTRRKSERPWSVSCLSQLTTDATQTSVKVVTAADVQAGLATHSISESALDSLSPGRPRASSSSAAHHAAQVKNFDSKGSLKRRKTRKKKLSNSANFTAASKKTDSGSEETAEMPKLTQTLLMKSCESMSAQQIQEITTALMNLQKCATVSTEQLANVAAVTSLGLQTPQQLAAAAAQSQQHHLQLQQQQNESDEDAAAAQLMKPNFRVGSYTTAYMRNEARLGSLAELATYMNDEEQQGEYTTGTEDHHSSFSETAWDNYQEKYNSENYSEGFDSDAARRLMEFGDDYRNFIDSQSDCCSSLSAANNLDSLSPPRMDSLQQNEAKIITQDSIVSSVDHARRRRALELECERRRKTLEVRRKSCQDTADNQKPRSPTMSLSSSANALTPKNADKLNSHHKADSASRKLEFSGISLSAQSLRRTSESDTSTRRRKVDERRRSSRNLEKCIKLIPATTSSSSYDDSDDEKEMRNLLQQSRNRLEDTRALKIRCHLLRPEDYTEIINTCRDNIRCLESVLRGPPGTVLSTACVSQTRDLLAAWEDLLGWSENAAAARKLQEEMIILKHNLKRCGNKASFELLDTEPAIQIAVEALKNEKSQLQTYRTNMLRLNASVHSWLTRQERKLQQALMEQQLQEAAAKVSDELAEKLSSTLVIEEKEEAAESEQQQQQQIQVVAEQLQQQLTEVATTTTTITVTDSNGVVQVEKYIAPTTTTVNTVTIGATTTTNNSSTNTPPVSATSTVACSSDKVWDLKMLMNSENEFHKHLKDEVSDMYSAWDEADARINQQLEVLTTSLVAWRQLECGLSEFQKDLGQDRGTLKGLEGALHKGQATPVELAQNVKLVAKLLSEKVNVSQEQLTAVQEHLDPNHILHIAKFTASNGSLSDSGISDGGTTSDGGLSERERRLGVLRRLAKQLESALAPGSEAMKSIAARMESAEAELKNLQNTCRDLIVRTAATHQNKKLLEAQQKAEQQSELAEGKQHKGNGYLKANGHAAGAKQTAADAESANKQQNSSPSKRRNKRRQRRNSNGSNGNAAGEASDTNADSNKSKGAIKMLATAPDGGDDDPADDPALEFDMTDDDLENGKPHKRGWAWRIAKAAVPMQLALFTFFAVAALMQPNCCDNLNNLTMSFTPQLRYIRGPPPI